MQITGDELVKIFYTSLTDNKMIEIIDSLGFEQPILDEEYELYKSVSTKDKNSIGIGLTFSELNKCKEIGIPCMDIISWRSDTKVKPPFGLSISFSYDDVCNCLGRKADYTSSLSKKLRTWVIDNKYLININFKTIDLIEIRSIVISPFTIDKLDDTYIENKD